MHKIDVEVLYHRARSQHNLRKDIALAAVRRQITRPGYLRGLYCLRADQRVVRYLGGISMGDVSPTGDQARDALRRYNEFVTRQLTRAFWSGDGNYAGGITQRDAWINARREYLANVLIEALRRNDPSKSG